MNIFHEALKVIEKRRNELLSLCDQIESGAANSWLNPLIDDSDMPKQFVEKQKSKKLNELRGESFGLAFATGVLRVLEIEASSRVKPPFAIGSELLCVRDAPEMRIDGEEYSPPNCICVAGHKYTIDFCLWSEPVGWIVSISGELHRAQNFQST